MGKQIAFIGVGVMGASIVKHLLAAGYEVTIYTRTKEKALPLVQLGAAWASSVKHAVKDKEIVFTMVGMPSDVQEVYYGEAGILQNVKLDTVVIDMTTSQPSLAQRIARDGETYGVHCLDAPVSGGDIGAQNGTLSIMVGGNPTIYEQIQPILLTFGSQIVYQGTAGSGQHAKMCNQIVAVNNLIGVCESLVYAIKSGLNPVDVLQSISSGAAGSWALTNLGPKILQSDYAPGFYIKHMLKDLQIALKEAATLNLQLPGLEKAEEMFRYLQLQGYSSEGTQALMRWYKNNAYNS